MTKPSPQRWFPLESNPSLMNDYVNKLGWMSDAYEFVDVFSTDDWALDMIPQPVAAVIMLYPLTDKQLNHDDGNNELSVSQEYNKDVWFMKQRIGNACGTIGLLHALLNTPKDLQSAFIQPNSWLKSFMQSNPSTLDPVSKAESLESNDKIATLHDAATSSDTNATNRGNIDDKIITHFVSLICVNDVLYELDGRKEGPVQHGKTSSTTLLKDSCRVVKEFMARDPDEMRFTILALAPKQG